MITFIIGFFAGIAYKKLIDFLWDWAEKDDSSN